MRKLLLLGVFALIFAGCKTTSVGNTKLDKSSQVDIKGNWRISSVSYPGSEVIKVTSFDIADSQCFVGSTWNFISNNNKGSFILNNSDCASYSSPITWYINKEGQFVLKVLDEGLKSKKVKTGYFLMVENQSENSFQLVDKINVGNSPTSVVYQFEKVN